MARLLVLWTRPCHLSADHAQAWAQEEVRRLLDVDGVERALLIRLRSASARHAAGSDWLLELHLAADTDPAQVADAAPVGEWLADLHVLRLRPQLLLADGGIALSREVR